LSLLFVLSSILPHQLITDQCTGDEPDRAAYEGTNGGMSNGATDDCASSSADTAANQTSLLPTGEWLRTT
jgi:hypothetical protein